MENKEEFNKRRKRGLWILIINEILAVACFIYYFNQFNWLFYTSVVYGVVSTLLLLNRIIKSKPKEDDTNYIYGKNLGEKMNKVPQKFIYEAMMMSMSIIIVTGIFSTIYSLFFTNLELIYKIVIGISGVTAAIFMTFILISNFQQYKQYMAVQQIEKDIQEKGLIRNNPWDDKNE